MSDDDKYIEEAVHPILEKLGEALASVMPENPEEYSLLTLCVAVARKLEEGASLVWRADTFSSSSGRSTHVSHSFILQWLKHGNAVPASFTSAKNVSIEDRKKYVQVLCSSQLPFAYLPERTPIWGESAQLVISSSALPAICSRRREGEACCSQRSREFRVLTHPLRREQHEEYIWLMSRARGEGKVYVASYIRC